MSELPHPEMPEPERPLVAQPAEALTGADWSAGVDIERRSGVRADISNAMVALEKRFYHSQVTFRPTRSFEIFVLDPAPLTGRHNGDRREEP